MGTRHVRALARPARRVVATARERATTFADDEREGLRRSARRGRRARRVDRRPRSRRSPRPDATTAPSISSEIVDVRARRSSTDYAARASALDAAGGGGARRRHRRAARARRLPLSARTGAAFPHASASRRHVGADRPRPGHLHVSSLATAGSRRPPLVFVVGLEEGRVFPAPFEDPILLDDERERISPRSPLGRSHGRGRLRGAQPAGRAVRAARRRDHAQLLLPRPARVSARPTRRG